MTAVEELESRRANRALDTDDSNYGLPTYVLRPSARHAHAAAYIAQTGRSVGLELVAHRVATLRYEWGRPEHGHIVLLRKVGAHSMPRLEANQVPPASSGPERESVSEPGSEPGPRPEPQGQVDSQTAQLREDLAAPMREPAGLSSSACQASDWSGFAPALSALQPQCGPFARTSDSSNEGDALLSAWLGA